MKRFILFVGFIFLVFSGNTQGLHEYAFGGAGIQIPFTKQTAGMVRTGFIAPIGYELIPNTVSEDVWPLNNIVIFRGPLIIDTSSFADNWSGYKLPDTAGIAGDILQLSSNNVLEWVSNSSNGGGLTADSLQNTEWDFNFPQNFFSGITVEADATFVDEIIAEGGVDISGQLKINDSTLTTVTTGDTIATSEWVREQNYSHKESPVYGFFSFNNDDIEEFSVNMLPSTWSQITNATNDAFTTRDASGVSCSGDQFTVSVDGVYQITYNFSLASSGTGLYDIRTAINSADAYDRVREYKGSSVGSCGLSFTAVLSAGDVVMFQVRNRSNLIDPMFYHGNVSFVKID